MQLRTFSRLAGAVAITGLAAACMHQAAPATLDYASTRLSEQGTYRVSYASDSSPIPVNQMHTWTLHA
jgi:hypothetical protein